MYNTKKDFFEQTKQKTTHQTLNMCIYFISLLVGVDLKNHS